MLHLFFPSALFHITLIRPGRGTKGYCGFHTQSLTNTSLKKNCRKNQMWKCVRVVRHGESCREYSVLSDTHSSRLSVWGMSDTVWRLLFWRISPLVPESTLIRWVLPTLTEIAGWMWVQGCFCIFFPLEAKFISFSTLLQSHVENHVDFQWRMLYNWA